MVFTWPEAEYAQAKTIHMCISGHLSVTGLYDGGPIAKKSSASGEVIKAMVFNFR
jgi:hypothetical protein